MNQSAVPWIPWRRILMENSAGSGAILKDEPNPTLRQGPGRITLGLERFFLNLTTHEYFWQFGHVEFPNVPTISIHVRSDFLSKGQKWSVVGAWLGWICDFIHWIWGQNVAPTFEKKNVSKWGSDSPIYCSWWLRHALKNIFVIGEKICPLLWLKLVKNAKQTISQAVPIISHDLPIIIPYIRG